MMAPLTPDSRNTLWEYLGRRFINLEYAEADRFCRQSKEFITALFPKGEIYASLLPPEARNLIGKVSPEAQPARAMLESLGFKYLGHCDPFDGGPYLEAKADDIALITQTRSAKLGEARGAEGSKEYAIEGFVSFTGPSGFRAVRTNYAESDGGKTLHIPPEKMSLIGAQPGDSVAVTPRTKTAAAATDDAVAQRKTIAA
jgi:arginine N-succinyltransferase